MFVAVCRLSANSYKHQGPKPALSRPVFPPTSGKRWRSISCRTSRMLEGFSAQTVGLINVLWPLPLQTINTYLIWSNLIPLCERTAASWINLIIYTWVCSESLQAAASLLFILILDLLSLYFICFTDHCTVEAGEKQHLVEACVFLLQKQQQQQPCEIKINLESWICASRESVYSNTWATWEQHYL